MPFAVIGSDNEVAVGGKKVLGRQTKWGFIEVENKKHCEFSLLRDMLIRWVGVSRIIRGGGGGKEGSKAYLDYLFWTKDSHFELYHTFTILIHLVIQ